MDRFVGSMKANLPSGPVGIFTFPWRNDLDGYRFFVHSLESGNDIQQHVAVETTSPIGSILELP